MSAEFESLINRAMSAPDDDGKPTQGSAAWLYERCGFVTASRFKDVMDRLKSGKPGAKREKYLMELVVERITGQPQDHFTSAAMSWGTDQEKPSRMAYEAATGRMVEEVGFIKHPTLARVGGSPDGLIGEDGGWESKSPWNTANHIETLLDGMPEEHRAQVQGLMWLTGRKWWDFQSFDPRLPAPMDRYCQRIERDEDYISELAGEVMAFNDAVAAMVARILDKYPLQDRAGGHSSQGADIPPASASGAPFEVEP